MSWDGTVSVVSSHEPKSRESRQEYVPRGQGRDELEFLDVWEGEGEEKVETGLCCGTRKHASFKNDPGGRTALAQVPPPTSFPGRC